MCIDCAGIDNPGIRRSPLSLIESDIFSYPDLPREILSHRYVPPENHRSRWKPPVVGISQLPRADPPPSVSGRSLRFPSRVPIGPAPASLPGFGPRGSRESPPGSSGGPDANPRPTAGRRPPPGIGKRSWSGAHHSEPSPCRKGRRSWQTAAQRKPAAARPANASFVGSAAHNAKSLGAVIAASIPFPCAAGYREPTNVTRYPVAHLPSTGPRDRYQTLWARLARVVTRRNSMMPPWRSLSLHHLSGYHYNS